MKPVKSIFPAHDKAAWERGDVSTESLDLSLGKLVSHDLNAMAPRLEKFLESIQLDIEIVNELLLEQKSTGVGAHAAGSFVTQIPAFFFGFGNEKCTPSVEKHMKTPGEGWEPLMCRWLQNNTELWHLVTKYWSHHVQLWTKKQ